MFRRLAVGDPPCGDVLMPSLPFLFVLAAGGLSPVALACLAFELLGRYWLQAGRQTRSCNPVDPRGFVRAVEGLLARGAPGRGKVDAALAQVAPGVGGPREAAVRLRLSLPPSMGGYAIPAAALRRLSATPQGLACAGVGLSLDLIRDDRAFDRFARELAANCGVVVPPDDRGFYSSRLLLRSELRGYARETGLG